MIHRFRLLSLFEYLTTFMAKTGSSLQYLSDTFPSKLVYANLSGIKTADKLVSANLYEFITVLFFCQDHLHSILSKGSYNINCFPAV